MPNTSSKAKCFRCGATAHSVTFEQARKQLNHATGLARGIKCGDSYGAVKEIGKPRVQPPQTITQTKKEEKKDTSTISDISPPNSDISNKNTSPKIEKTKTSKKFKDTKS